MAEKEWLTIPEIAAETGKSADYVRGMIKYHATPDQQRQRLPAGRGRVATEYHLTCLPQDMQLAVRPDAAPLPVPLPPKRQQPEELKDWQKEKWAACLGVVKEVHRLEADGTPRYKAIETFCNYFNGGFCQHLLPASRTKTLRATRVYELCRLYDEGGELALMPADRSMPKLRKDEWLPYFLQRIWRDRDTGKNGRSLSDCYRDLEAVLPRNVPLPTEQTVRNYLAKMSSVERNKNRKTGNEMRATKVAAKMIYPQVPLACVGIDGKSFQVRVKHPATGKAKIMEVCWVIDIATRKILGWAMGDSESKWTVSGALLHAFWYHPVHKPHGGVPLVVKSDGGSGNKSKLVSGLWGVLAAAGVQKHEIGRPDRSNDNPHIEAAQKHLNRIAQKFWSYCGKSGDKGTLRERYLAIKANEEKNYKETGKRTCTLLTVPTVADVLLVLQEEFIRIDNRSHTGLPKYYCPIENKEKHFSPNQYWQHLVDAGWQQPPAIPLEILKELQYPRLPRVCGREVVRAANGFYHSPALAGYDGAKVLVQRYLWDAQIVGVYEPNGRKICDARLDGHAKDALAQTPLEEAAGQRNKRIIALKQLHIANQEQEYTDTMALLSPQRALPAPVQQLGGPIAPWKQPALPAPAREPEPPTAPLMPILSGEEFHALCAAAVDRGEVLSEDDRETLAGYYRENPDHLVFGGRNLLA